MPPVETNINSIMKELSDIKASLAVNTNETQNIKNSLGEIKVDMKEIKSEFINRREFNEAIVAVYDQISPIKKGMYGVIAAVLLAVVGTIMKIILVK